MSSRPSLASKRTPAFKPEGEDLIGQMKNATCAQDSWKLIMATRRMEMLVGNPAHDITGHAQAIERFAQARDWEKAQETIGVLEWAFTLESNPTLTQTPAEG